MSRLSSGEAPVEEAPVRDELREGLLERVMAELGDAVVGHPPEAGRRPLGPGAHRRVGARPARSLRDRLGFDYFCFLSAIDWMPSPYGKGEDDPTQPPPERSTAIVQGYAGGDTRFQVLARVESTTEHVGVTLKVDVPDDTATIATWVARSTPAPTGTSARPGRCSASPSPATPTSATCTCRPTSRAIPLRKDFPLLARMVKPWPGIVDVEPMPGDDDEADRGRRGRRGGRMTVVSDRQKLAYIAAQAADARVNVELETEGMTLNIGPQHPATHGTLRIICRLDGEQVVWADPSAGYMHRGYEKLTEVRTFPQVTTLVNRIDWLGSFANEVPVHPGRRAADGDRGAAPGAVDPHHPVRAVPHRQRRRCSSATWACSSGR